MAFIIDIKKLDKNKLKQNEVYSTSPPNDNFRNQTSTPKLKSTAGPTEAITLTTFQLITSTGRPPLQNSSSKSTTFIIPSSKTSDHGPPDHSHDHDRDHAILTTSKNPLSIRTTARPTSGHKEHTFRTPPSNVQPSQIQSLIIIASLSVIILLIVFGILAYFFHRKHTRTLRRRNRQLQNSRARSSSFRNRISKVFYGTSKKRAPGK